jgi:autotransporter-associated beta strand protein
VSVAAGGGTIDTDGNAVVFGGKLSGAGMLTVSDSSGTNSGSLTFMNQSSGTTGPVTINAGTSLALVPLASATSSFIGVGSGTATSVINGSLYLGETAAQATSTGGATPTLSVADLEATANTTIVGTGSIYMAPGSTMDIYVTSATASANFTFTENANLVLTSDQAHGHSLAATQFNTLSLGGAIGGTTTGLTIGGTPTTSGTPVVIAGSSLIGKVIFGGTNTYSGPTTVKGGTLVVNGSISSASAVTVAAATSLTTAAGTAPVYPVLAGTGTVSGTVNLSGAITAGSGATASDSVGILHTGVETWNTGSAYFVKLAAGAKLTAGVNGDAGQPGTVNDELVIADLSPSSSGLTVSPIALSGLASGTYSFLIANDTSSTTAFNSMLNSTLTASAATLPTGSSATLAAAADGGGEDLFLNVVVVGTPEPTSLLLLGLAAGPLAIGRRRRRSAARANA